MSRIFLTSNVQSTFSLNDLAVHTPFFERWYNFHDTQITINKVLIYFYSSSSLSRWWLIFFIIILRMMIYWIISIRNASLTHIVLIHLNLYTISFNHRDVRLFHFSCFITHDNHFHILKFNSKLSCRKYFNNFTI